MPQAHPLPPDLLGRPFTVTEALARGLTPDHLRGRRFRAPFRGVRVAAELPETLELRCQAALLVLPHDAVFSHLTSARLQRVVVPGDWADEPLDVQTSTRGLRARGVRFRTASAHLRAERAGLPVTSPATTWCQLASVLGLDDLVIAGDSLLRSGCVRAEQLVEASTQWCGRPGARLARAGSHLLAPGTDSPMETRLRLLLVRAGLPQPQVNVDVVVDGAWLARPDLSYPQWRIAIEYEGDHHRTDRRQWKRDKARRRLLEDHGWLVIEVIDDDVYKTPELTVARIRAAVVARSS